MACRPVSSGRVALGPEERRQEPEEVVGVGHAGVVEVCVAAEEVRLHEAEGGGVDTASMFVQSLGGSIEAFAESSSDVLFHIVGFWAVPPLPYIEAYYDIGGPSQSATWQTISEGVW